jgi:hypothetical protein
MEHQICHTNKFLTKSSKIIRNLCPKKEKDEADLEKFKWGGGQFTVPKELWRVFLSSIDFDEGRASTIPLVPPS